MWFKYKLSNKRIALVEAGSQEEANTIVPEEYARDRIVTFPMYYVGYYWKSLGNGLQKWTERPMQEIHTIEDYAEYCRKELMATDKVEDQKAIAVIYKDKVVYYAPYAVI